MNEKNKYLKTYNEVYKQVQLMGFDPLDPKTKYLMFYPGWPEYKQKFGNIATLVVEMVNKNYVALEFNKNFYDKNAVCVTVVLSLDEEISKTTFDLLKEFANKKSDEYKQQLEYALLNGHITFKQYNQLYKEAKSL